MNMPPFSEAIKVLDHELKEYEKQADLNKSHGWKNDEEIQAAKEIQDAIAFLGVASLGGMSALVSLIRQWGVDKSITGPGGKATLETQYKKLLEEVGEICEGIHKQDQHEIIDGIGDATVVLILLADLAGVKFETCLLAAFDEIKGRTGRMENGIFIKDQ